MIEAIILLLAGLGILLVGFKLLSENIEKVANKGLKRLLNKTSKKPIVGAGIMNLFQATAMIMGANIGTTITAQIVALGSFDFSMYAMILAPIGMFMYMLFKKDRFKSLGLALSGLGLVFIALILFYYYYLVWFLQQLFNLQVL